jgi:hypothetical protein
MTRELTIERSQKDYQRLEVELRSAYSEIIDFVTTEPFKAVYNELMSLSPTDRPQFVVDVILNDDVLAKRGVTRPPDLLILRSAFGDRRPTLFCVKKWLPPDLRMFWENANITFDNDYDDDSIPRDESAWRPPLPVPIQHEYLSGNLESADVDSVVDALRPLTSLNL